MVYANNVYYYSNKMGRIIFLAAEEITGQNGAKVVSNPAGFPEFVKPYPPSNQNPGFSFGSFSQVQTASKDFYSPIGGQVVAQRMFTSMIEKAPMN